MANFETVIVETDVLILGGGMAACGAAVEAAYWAKQNGLKVTIVDKAAMDRSGAVAMGLSAINQYVGIAAGDKYFPGAAVGQKAAFVPARNFPQGCAPFHIIWRKPAVHRARIHCSSIHGLDPRQGQPRRLALHRRQPVGSPR